MPDHFLFLFTCVLHAGAALLASFLCLPAPGGKTPFCPTGINSGHAKVKKFFPGNGLSLLLALAAFQAIPPGGLPPLWNTPFSGAACLVLLGASALCMPAQNWKEHRARAAEGSCLALLVLVFYALAWHAWARGFPGSPANLGSYAAMPVWTASAAGNAARGFFAASLILAVLPLSEEGCAFPAGPSLRFTAALCLVVVWFAPWNPSSFLPLHGYAAFALDALFFWGKVIALARIVRFLRGKLPGKGMPLWLAWACYAAGFCCLAGILLCRPTG